MGSHKPSQSALLGATHNLEVVGSSPTWSTLEIRELRKFRNSLYLFSDLQVTFLREKYNISLLWNKM